MDRNGKQVPSSEVCKIGIQLYKTTGRDAGTGQGMAPLSSGVSSTSSASGTPTMSSPALGPTNANNNNANAMNTTSISSSPPNASALGLALSEPQGNYVIDMQKLCGQTFHYLELSTNIIGALQHIHPQYVAPQHHFHHHMQ
jgi:hypothetical protein